MSAPAPLPAAPVWRYLNIVGILEGLSYLLLLGVAMPLKYMANMPQPVRYTGWAHGLLFVLFIAVLVLAWRQLRWPLTVLLAGVFASLLPFGPFVFHYWLRLKYESGVLKTPEK